MGAYCDVCGNFDEEFRKEMEYPKDSDHCIQDYQPDCYYYWDSPLEEDYDWRDSFPHVDCMCEICFDIADREKENQVAITTMPNSSIVCQLRNCPLLVALRIVWGYIIDKLTPTMNYLNETLLPLIEGIKPRQSESYTLAALGLERQSSQSILIAFGERIEQFWNKVISDSQSTNLIEDNNLIEVNGKMRQIDHNFVSEVDGVNYYLESKCNLNFDSEKVKASNKKINEVKTALGAEEGAYFVPVVRNIPQKELTKYNNKGLNVYGVNWLLNQVNAPFTENEYFNFLETTIAPLLESKGL